MSATTESERAIVTVLAADVVGSTNHILGSDPDDAQIFLDRCFEEFRGAVESFGGRLISYEGDGGIAVFGWPEPLEDHADRACAAAWRLQHPNARPLGPTGQPVSLRLGVHSGLAGVRHLDQPGRSGWNAVGATVNLAAKLQQTAQAGEVLISAATVELCRSTLTLAFTDDDPAVQASGLEAFRLHAQPNLGAPRAGRYRTPLVGRTDEVRWLGEALLTDGGGIRLASVVGEAGIGKSRLAHAVSSQAFAQGWRTITVYGDAQTRASPFAVALAVVAALLDLPDRGSPNEFGDALERAGLDRETSGLLSKLFGGDTRRTLANQMQITRAFVRVLLAPKRSGPLLLVVEDLHLVDLESQGVLSLLAPEHAEPALSLLITGRPEALRDAREIGGASLELQPLPPAEMRAIARQICPESTAADLLEQIVERADGVVFVLEEFARSISSGASNTDLPVSIESAIHARLGLLSRAAKDIAQTLSLLGEEVELELLGQVAHVDADQLARSLAELERLAFVHPPRGQRASFRHHILGEACANTIPRQRRVGLHRAALVALEGRHHGVPGRRLRLATHAEGAGDDARALTFLWEAASEARGTSGAASLNIIFDRALAVIERLGEAGAKTYVDFVLLVFPSMLLLGEFSKMETHLPTVMALARAQQRPEKVANSLSQFGMLCWFQGRYDDGRRATEEGRRIARRLDLPALVYSNQLMLANVLHGLGRIDQAIAELEDLKTSLSGELASARWGAPAIPLSTTLSFIGWIKADIDQFGEALDHGRRGLEIARQQGDSYAEIMARNALGRAFLYSGRNGEAVSCLQAAWDLAEMHGYDATKSNLAGHMASALARLGRPDDAIALVESCLARHLHLRTGRMENVLLKAGYAEAVACAGDTDRGLALLDEALEIAGEIDNPCLLARGLDLRAVLRASADPGDPRIAADRSAAADQRRRLSAVSPPAGSA